MQLLDATEAQKENAAGWAKAYDAALKIVQAKGADSRELEFVLRDGSDFYDEARVGAWRFVATAEREQIARFRNSADKATAYFEKLKRDIGDATLADAVAQQIKVVADFKAIMNCVVAASDDISSTVKTKALPTATLFTELSDKLVEVASHNAEAADEHLTATMKTADRMSMGAGALVIAVLIGSAMFGMILIAKSGAPHRRSADRARERQQVGRNPLYGSRRRSGRRGARGADLPQRCRRTGNASPPNSRRRPTSGKS